jgi:hypothetical protein
VHGLDRRHDCRREVFSQLFLFVVLEKSFGRVGRRVALLLYFFRFGLRALYCRDVRPSTREACARRARVDDPSRRRSEPVLGRNTVWRAAARAAQRTPFITLDVAVGTVGSSWPSSFAGSLAVVAIFGAVVCD